MSNSIYIVWQETGWRDEDYDIVGVFTNEEDAQQVLESTSAAAIEEYVLYNDVNDYTLEHIT